MLEPVYLPQLGQTMAEGTVAKWHRHEGERIEKGEYGICESCGDPIPLARLEVLPYATLCVACAAKE